MFTRFVFIAAIFGFSLYWFLVRLQPEDLPNYEKLISESADLRTHKALEEKPALQTRKNVQKVIWTKDETERFFIQSETSDLVISQKKDKIEAVEQLKNIHCILPNESTLFADEGIYSYASKQFIARQNCKLKQGENQIEGTQVHFDFVEESISCENPKGRIALEDIAFTANSLFWEKDTNILQLIDEVTITQGSDLIILAKKGAIQLEEFKPVQLTLDGAVRLISSRIEGKESFAMADRLFYDPKAKTLLFSAETRVLFWQDGLTLSAEEVLIGQNQRVEGRGSVHFTFNLEEQNRIETFFKQYL